MDELKKDKHLKNYFHKEIKGPIYFYDENSKDKKNKNSFLIKDNFWTKSIQTTSSSLFLKGFLPFENSTVINLLEESGYNLLGKSYLDEFACGGLGLFSCEGKILNPHNKERVVGGSSSGSAFSVSEEIVDFSIGHDAGDSVRRPSSYCGIIGFKPSYGSISRYGVIPMASSFDTVGIMSKNIDTIKKVYQKISKVDYKDITTVALRKIGKKLLRKKTEHKKIAVFKDIEKLIPEEYSKLYKEKINQIKSFQNFTVENITIPKKIRENLQICYLILCSSEIVSHLSSLKGVTFGNKSLSGKSVEEKRSLMIGKWVKERIIIGNYFLEQKSALKKAKEFRIFLVDWMKKVFKKYDFLVFPGTQDIAPKIEDLNDINIKKSSWVDNLLLLSNFSGNPSINIPLGKVEKMPVSINIDSGWNNEEELINFSKIIIEPNKGINKS